MPAQVAAAHQRTDSDGRFARLLTRRQFHLARLFSPGYLPTVAAQAGAANSAWIGKHAVRFRQTGRRA